METMAGKDGTRRLVVLDSHAIIHRAYHAIPGLSSSKGEPTGALYGLISMLLRIIEDLKPDYIVAARDLPGMTHRHELFEEYKATRKEAEPELVVQLEKAPDVFKAFGIPLYEAAGFEADDVIGALVRQARRVKNLNIVIASGDLDTLQLVEGKRVQVYTLRKGLSDTILYDEDRVRERYGFGPEHIPDYKALRGDPSDNIPGVRGIGDKTATELIEEFGFLEEIYEALETRTDTFTERVKPRTVELLRNGRADALRSKKLAKISVHAPITFELPAERWKLTDHTDHILSLCDELEFRSLKERIRSIISGSLGTERETPAELPPSAEIIETAIALWLIAPEITNPGFEEILRYAHTDNFASAREKIFSDLRATGRLREVYEKIEKPLIPVVQRLNETGVFLDTNYLRKLGREYGRELNVIAGRVFAHAGHEFNINSPRQLAVVLFDELGIALQRHKKTSTGMRTTREEELERLVSTHPIIADVLAYRRLQKLLSTYIEKMPALVGSDGRLRAEFLQAGTATGRMASQNPNLQNIPVKTELGRRIRTAFAAEYGRVLIAIDYSQIELRIAAGLSGDAKLISVFERGGDVHAAVAAEVFHVPPEHVDYEMRRRAKIINFGILYGMGVHALRSALGEDVSRDEAARFFSEYFADFSGLARFIERTKAEARRLGYTETLFGRRRYFPAFKSALPNLVAQAERMAINAPIQGTQADIIKLAMVKVDRLIEESGWRQRAKLILQVHDELVYEVDERDSDDVAKALKLAMESVVSPEELHGVPIVAEVRVGRNWGDMEKLNTM